MGLALEESVAEGEDQVEQHDGVSIVYDKNIIGHLDNKVIDYTVSPAEGFIITSEGPNPNCGSCSC